MLINIPKRFAALLIGAIISTAALAGSGKPVEDKLLPIVLIQQSSVCGKLTSSQWLDDAQQYHATFKAMFRGLISDSKPEPTEIDFNSHAALLISMGQQRTGGYSVKLASEQMNIKSDRAEISVNWTAAKSGMVTIQMLTNPCLLLQVPRGDYQVIDIVDQSGKVKQTINVK